MRIRRGWLVALLIALIPLAVAVSAIFLWPRLVGGRRPVITVAPEAPPDLEKLRARFESGLSALQRGDGAGAAREFGSFNFGSRSVEEYRLYFLAQAFQMSGNAAGARVTLRRLWD